MAKAQIKNETVTELKTDTVEFTTDGATPQVLQETASANAPHRVALDENGPSRETPDLGTSVYAAELERNELFQTSGDASAAFRAWQASDKSSMVYIDRAVKEALVKFGMHKEPGKANASPLTHAVKAMEHRGKKNLASKLIAFVQAVTNYKWDTKKDVFRLKKDKDVSTAFTLEQRAIYDAPFWEYVKPTKKTDWEFQAALAKVLERADREGISVDERAKVVALFTSGNTPKTVNVSKDAGATIRNDLKTAEQVEQTAANNSKDAA